MQLNSPLSLFNGKFFNAEARFTLAELDWTRQHSNEDLGICMRTFHKNAHTLDCCDPVSKEILVSVCLHGMVEEYRVFLEILSFSSFAKLMKSLVTPTSWYVNPQGLARALGLEKSP